MQNIIHPIYLFVMAHVTCVTIENTKSLDPAGEKVISNLGAFCTSIYHTSFHKQQYYWNFHNKTFQDME